MSPTTVVVRLCGLLRLSWRVVGKETCHNTFRQMSSTVVVCLCGLLQLSWSVVGKETSSLFHLNIFGISITGAQWLYFSDWDAKSDRHSRCTSNACSCRIPSLQFCDTHMLKKWVLQSAKGWNMSHTHNFYRHMFFWIIYFQPFETSATASCGYTGTLPSPKSSQIYSGLTLTIHDKSFLLNFGKFVISSISFNHLHPVGWPNLIREFAMALFFLPNFQIQMMSFC